MSFLSSVFYHFLLPGYSNNHKAKILHSESIVIIVLFLIAGQYLVNLFPTFGIRILGYASQIPVEEVIRLTNEKRMSVGIGALSYSTQLASAAKAKGEDMLAKDYWSHVAPDGTEPWKFFTDAGYKYRYAGENLAKDFSNPQSAVDAWMASTSHKENLLSSKYDEIGIAVVEGDLNGVDTTIIVQLFGKRYDTAIAVATTKVSAKTDVVNSDMKLTITPSPLSLTTPTVIPTPSPTTSGDAFLAGETNQTYGETYKKPSLFQAVLSPFTTKKGFSGAATSVLLTAFCADAYFIAKKKVVRVGGRTAAHIIFLGMILAVVILVQSGDILPPAVDTLK